MVAVPVVPPVVVMEMIPGVVETGYQVALGGHKQRALSR